ncbi:MAG TPA: hypothetical protein VGC84_18920 [Ilumatobacteraceae bacterium]
MTSRVIRTCLAALLVVGVGVAVLAVRGWRPAADAPRVAAAPATMPASAAIEETYGVRFTGVDVTAGGGMIQIHYQVLDSDKTQAIHAVDVAPIVIDGRGVKYADPGMVGHSHVAKAQASGTTDYILLANAKGGVTPGSMVTIKVGSLELQNVPVL